MEYYKGKSKLQKLAKKVEDNNLSSDIHQSGSGYLTLLISKGEYEPTVSIEISLNGFQHHVTKVNPLGAHRSNVKSFDTFKDAEECFMKEISETYLQQV